MERLGNLSITPEILRLISGIDEFKGRWESLGRLKPERLAALRRVATIESVGSSTRIEGARLSNGEVERLLSGLDFHSFRTRDEQEVAGYSELMNQVFESYAEISLSENHLKQMHGILLKYSEKDQWHRGEYKKNANQVEAFDAEGKSLGVIFQTASPFETPGLMGRLVSETREGLAGGTFHPLLIIAMFTLRFLSIHPFQDGNGRLSRILTVYLLLRAGYRYVPYSSMERVIEENKDRYYLALRRAQAEDEGSAAGLEEWVLFFLRVLEEQKEQLRRRIEEERLLVVLPELAERLLRLAGERGRLVMGEAIRLTGARRETIKLHLRRLVVEGLLSRHGKGKGSWYSVERATDGGRGNGGRAEKPPPSAAWAPGAAGPADRKGDPPTDG